MFSRVVVAPTPTVYIYTETGDPYRSTVDAQNDTYRCPSRQRPPANTLIFTKKQWRC